MRSSCSRFSLPRSCICGTDELLISCSGLTLSCDIHGNELSMERPYAGSMRASTTADRGKRRIKNFQGLTVVPFSYRNIDNP